MDICEVCETGIARSKTGRPRRFCSNACRQKAYRRESKTRAELYAEANRHIIPEELRIRNRWVRHIGKRPLAIGGWFCSVNDERAFSTYAAVKESTRGDGYGFVLNGDGVVCIDLDDCVVDGQPNRAAQNLIDTLPETYVEFSPSGNGLHIWGFGKMEKGRRFSDDGLKIEVYPSARFITVTARPYVRARLAILDLHRALRVLAV